jgi:hypothetical protein
MSFINPTPDSELDENRRRLRAAATTGADLSPGDPNAVFAQAEITRLLARVQELEALINTPHTAEFLEAVRLEAAHQRERWSGEHDAGKTDADWFWLIGYLCGKALYKPEKQVHHIITTAAALLNWHAAKTGSDTRMRPGIGNTAP